MHNVWAMLLGRLVSDRAAEAAAGAVNFAFFPLLLAAVFGWARELRMSRPWSLIAVAMIATVPTAYHVAANEYVDVALALFITLALYAVSRWWDDPGSGWLVYIAVFLGAALSIKFTALVVIAAVALVILLRARKETGPGLRKVLIGGFGALVLAGAIASPWYVRTWKETGSPIFPFYMNIWMATCPDGTSNGRSFSSR
jgi:4-amino-4-deoxy-L-arabinose transferase-like glycosyltransferase